MTTLSTPLIRITLGTWLVVAAYAVAHDQYIVWLSPEHFTVWHPPVPGVTSPRLQAAILAFNAAFLPGMAFGLVLAMAAVEGPWRPLPVRDALWRAVAAVGVTEVVSAAVGVASYRSAWRTYGVAWYPAEADAALIAAQSIQLTAYSVGALSAGATILSAAVVRARRHAAHPPQAVP